MFNFIVTLEDKFRFWNRITTQMSEDGCWLFRGKSRNPTFSIDEKIYRASRFSYYMYNGPFDESLDVCHTCDIPCCMNPKHLFLGTQQDNMSDMVSKGRGRNSPRLGERNPCSVLTEAQVLDIRESLALGASLKDLSGAYGVCKATISEIKQGRNWKHLQEK